jgi:hypothetical protein
MLHTANAMASLVPPEKIDEASRDQPSSIIAKAQMKHPASMKGRRRPHRDFERSAKTPMRG